MPFVLLAEWAKQFAFVWKKRRSGKVSTRGQKVVGGSKNGWQCDSDHSLVKERALIHFSRCFALRSAPSSASRGRPGRNYVFQEVLPLLLETANGFFETEPYPRLNLL